MLNILIYYDKPVGHLYGVRTSYSTGDNINSLVANDETVFKLLSIRTY